MIINAVDGVQVKAIVGCAPTNEIKTSQYPYFDDEQAINFEKATGIKSRRIVDGQYSSDFVKLQSKTS